MPFGQSAVVKASPCDIAKGVPNPILSGKILSLTFWQTVERVLVADGTRVSLAEFMECNGVVGIFHIIKIA